MKRIFLSQILIIIAFLIPSHLVKPTADGIPVPSPEPVLKHVPIKQTTYKPRAEAKRKPAPAAKRTQPKPSQVPAGSHAEWMSQAGITAEDQSSVEFVIHHESTWRPNAVNFKGCIGLYQACPDGDMPNLLRACPDWKTNPVCQLKEATRYAGRYGGWKNAASVWQNQQWW